MIERFLQWRAYRFQLSRAKYNKRRARAIERLWKEGKRPC